MQRSCFHSSIVVQVDLAAPMIGLEVPRKLSLGCLGVMESLCVVITGEPPDLVPIARSPARIGTAVR